MNGAFDTLAEQEAEALVRVLEAEGRKVLVVVIASTADGEGGATGALCRSVSDGTKGVDARMFVRALDRERDRIASRLVRKDGA